MAKFITLEGIEGSGKTTNLRIISRILKDKKIKYIETKEPGGSLLGKKLRKFLLDPKTKISSEAELLLMLADRKNHVEEIIIPSLQRDTWVISDRFMDSSYAYQGGGRKININTIKSFAKFLNFPKPDLTLLFDLPVKLALERAKIRSQLDRFEKEEVKFHNRIRKVYLDLSKKNKGRIKIIDASKDIKSVSTKVTKEINNLFNGKT